MDRQEVVEILLKDSILMVKMLTLILAMVVSVIYLVVFLVEEDLGLGAVEM